MKRRTLRVDFPWDFPPLAFNSEGQGAIYHNTLYKVQQIKGFEDQEVFFFPFEIILNEPCDTFKK